MSSRSIYVVPNSRISFFLVHEQYSIAHVCVCKCNILATHLLTRHLGYLRMLATGNNAAMNVGVQTSLQKSASQSQNYNWKFSLSFCAHAAPPYPTCIAGAATCCFRVRYFLTSYSHGCINFFLFHTFFMDLVIERFSLNNLNTL